MNVVTYLFSLSDTTADELRWKINPWLELPACPAFSVTPVELSWLGEILGAGPQGSLLKQCSLAAGESQEPPWVVSLPPALVSALRAIVPEESHEVAGRWGLVDEMAGALPLDSLVHFLDAAVEFLEYRADPIVLYVAQCRGEDLQE
jgi:hypothetical protein